MKPDDPLDKARSLEERVRETLAEAGAELEELSITLDPDHDDILSLRIKIKPQTLMTPDEEVVNKKFDDIIKGI